MRTNKLAWLAPVILLAIILGWPFKGAAQTTQYLTLYTSGVGGATVYSVQTNQIISVVGYDWTDKPTLYGAFLDGTQINLTPCTTSGPFSGTVLPFASQIPQTVTGLTNIVVGSAGSLHTWATFQITTPASPSVVSNYVPADAIVVPASATGNVQIILESSPDLVNWTAASPGTYGASAGTNRFFRVRAAVN